MSIFKRIWNFLVTWGDAIAEQRKNPKNNCLY